jgi:hypothetical protein
MDALFHNYLNQAVFTYHKAPGHSIEPQTGPGFSPIFLSARPAEQTGQEWHGSCLYSKIKVFQRSRSRFLTFFVTS